MSIVEDIAHRQDWLENEGLRARAKDYILAYLAVSDVTPSKLGWRSVSSTTFVPRFLSGETVTVDKLDEVLLYIRFNTNEHQLKAIDALLNNNQPKEN